MTPGDEAKRRVLIFRNEVLPGSETFILAQARSLTRFEPVFGGVHAAVSPLDLPSAPLLLDATCGISGKIRRRVFWGCSFAPKFYRDLQGAQVDLVHAHFAVDAAAALPLVEALRVPLVVTLHGYDVTSSDAALSSRAEGRLYLRRRERLWEQAKVFLCVSEFIRSKAIEKGFPSERLRVLYTGTDMTQFAASKQVRERGRIVFVGRLVEKKGLRHLLDAMRLVHRNHPGVELAILGGGPLEAEMQAKARADGLRCCFLGMQPVEVVREYLSRARVFCAPSVSAASGDSEGLGMVFVEAQAVGTPVVSFRHGGIPEAVLDGETGLLAPEGDSEALAKSLVRLLAEDELWTKMSGNAAAWVRRSFSLQQQTARLEDVYDAALHRAI